MNRTTTKSFFLGARFFRTASLCLLTIVTLAGCASPRGKVVSKRDPSFDGKLQNVLVICPDKRVSVDLGNQFAPRFLNQLTNALAQNNIPAGSVEVDQEALDNGDLIGKAANRCHAGQLLSWQIAGMNTMSSVRQTLPGDIPRFQSATSVALEFQVHDVWVNRAVWRARFLFQTSPRPEDVADQLVEELIATKLLIPQSTK